ncbi:MAG: hypothetical protein GXP04_09260 [Alphaproteobacteria bacterium]|nr:hypothetical protein [Alphaproteobacteria bacterium]
MRITTALFPTVLLASLAFLSGCERNETNAPSATAPVEPVEISASDRLSDLSATMTGIAFWSHPNVAFNSLVIVASQDGIASYNIEDGSEVSRIPAVNAQGAAVSYLGLGAQARGLLAFLDIDASVFKINAIDNASRSFQAVDGEIPFRGALRGFCFGRAAGGQNPVLYALQKGEMTHYAIEVEGDALTASAGIAQSVPEDAQSCTVDGIDGSVLITRSNGEIHRMTDDGPGELVVSTDITEIGDVAILLIENTEPDPQSVSGLIVALNRETGGLHVFNREDGQAIGVMTVMAEDADSEYGEFIAVNAGDVMGAASANLGGLYRNGVLALGVGNAEAEQPAVIHLIPMNALKNTLDLPESEPVNPRGREAEPEEDGLLIDIDFQRD